MQCEILSARKSHDLYHICVIEPVTQTVSNMDAFTFSLLADGPVQETLRVSKEVIAT